MKLSKIRVSNFKKINEVTVPLNSINYIVGGNSSGKSSLLQAIHMGVGCAQISRETGEKVIAESALRYSPTADFTRLGHDGPYGNRQGGSRGVIEFFGESDAGDPSRYSIEIYKARNHHNIGVSRTGDYTGFGDVISDPQSLFSVYVPGLAGIPAREALSGFAPVFQRAAGGEANLVLRNIIRQIQLDGKLDELGERVSSILGPTRIDIKFDERHDLYMNVTVAVGDDRPAPIELCGTGVLQITQIFAYVILFRPKVLLVDEPDSHLHASLQGKLSQAFAVIADEYNCTILISTHSRHLLSAAPEGSRVIWLQDGKLVDDGTNADLTEVLMSIGALDQVGPSGFDVVICTEDEKTGVLEACVNHLGLEGRVRVVSYNGVNNAGNAEAWQSMADLLPNNPRIIVHRDRDFLTDDEVQKWGEHFISKGMTVFVPTLCDIESYFVLPEHLASFYDIDIEEARGIFQKILDENDGKLREQFKSKRRAANIRLWPDGGAPATSDLLPDGSDVAIDQIYGKDFLKWIKAHAKTAMKDFRDPMTEISVDLVAEVQQVLSGVMEEKLG